jgi:small GTP-binding protein
MILASSVKEGKLVMLGSTTVGKSSIVTRFCQDMFNPESAATIGAAFLSQTLEIEGFSVKLQIWDTGGSERYRSMAPMYFQSANMAVIVYDVTSRSSFNDVETWVTELRNKGLSSCLIALAGNKSDLTVAREVSKREGEELATKHKLDLFMETSALTGEHIRGLFRGLAEKWVKLGNSGKHDEGVRIEKTIDPRKRQKSDGCC